MCFEELDRYVELELTGQDAAAIIPGPRAAGGAARMSDRASSWASRRSVS
ncbi:MAG: hypothetical protein M3292_07875 [Actinomycetota bacterium]|nr:hypothetical protein [Actinomycetota bacterium]